MVLTGPTAKTQRPGFGPVFRADSYSGGSDAREGNGGEAVASSGTRAHGPMDFRVLLYHPKGLDEFTL